MLAGMIDSNGVLHLKPYPQHARTPHAGTAPLGLGQARDGLVHVPASVRADTPAPLVLMLHGAGSSASDVLPIVQDCADAHATVVLAPDSRGATWDLLERGFGPDVSFIERALETVFAACPIDPEQIAIAGFSDGGSYALSLGLTNGAFFRAIIAFSPGFASPPRVEDAPRIFISHGREDRVLPIERCGRRVATSLREAGHDIDYREFIGGHVVPSDLVVAAFQRFLG